jgi:hypothetical protein
MSTATKSSPTPPSPTPSSTAPSSTPARWWLVAVAAGAVAVAGATTVASRWDTHTAPAPVAPSLAEWVQGGGGQNVTDIQYWSHELAGVQNAGVARYLCGQLSVASLNARRYGPIPEPQAQTLWSSTVGATDNALASCSAYLDAGSPAAKSRVSSDARTVATDARKVVTRLRQQAKAFI